MTKIKAIVFDLWDTLIPATINFDHVKNIAKHDHLSKDEFVVKYERAVQLKQYVSFEDMRNDFFSEFNQHGNKELSDAFDDIYTRRMEEVNYFPDALSALQKLRVRGLKLGLLSNTESIGFDRLEKRLNFSKYFDILAPSFVVGELKPQKEAFSFVLNQLGVVPSAALMVGDSLRADIIGAQGVKMHNCLINRSGKEVNNKKAAPEFVIKSLEDLPSVLEILNRK